MATIGTQAQEYKPQSQFVPLDYRSLMEGVKTVRDRYDRSQASLTALQRLKAQFDPGENASGQELLNSMFSEVDNNLSQYTSKNINMIDAESAINAEAARLLGDEKTKALLDAQQKRAIGEEMKMKMGEGNYYDFNPYSQHQFIDAEGNVKRYQTDIADIGDPAAVKRQLMSNIGSEILDKFELKQSDVDAYLKYGTVDGVSDAMIRRVAEEKADEYRTGTSEGRVQERILRAQNPDMTEEQIRAQMTEELFQAGSHQATRKDNTKYIANAAYGKTGSGKGRDSSGNLLLSPGVGAMVELVENKKTRLTNQGLKDMGLETVGANKGYIGQFTSETGENDPQAAKDIDNISTISNQLDAANSTMLGRLRIAGGSAGQFMGREPDASETEAYNLTLSSLKQFVAENPEALSKGDSSFTVKDLAALEIKANEKLTSDKFVNNIGLLENYADLAKRYVKEKYNMTDEDLENQSLAAKLDITGAKLVVNGNETNTRLVRNKATGDNEVMVNGSAVLSMDQIKDQLDIDNLTDLKKVIKGVSRAPSEGEDMYYIPLTLNATGLLDRENLLPESTGYFKDPEMGQANWDELTRRKANQEINDAAITSAKQVLSSFKDSNLNLSENDIAAAHAALVTNLVKSKQKPPSALYNYKEFLQAIAEAELTKKDYLDLSKEIEKEKQAK